MTSSAAPTASPAMRTSTAGSTWAVVLAAGEGRRLRSLTRALYGRDVPKQFAEIEPGRTMLQATLDRVASIAPPWRTVVVVDATQEDAARAQLEKFAGVDLALQPRNLDTGPGVLFPLSRILARDPAATVAVFPSDHHVPREAPFLAAAEKALGAASWLPGRVTLLGVVPDDPEGEYGWIVPGERIGGGRAPRDLRSVRRFVEKPARDEAERLFARGAVWNTFVSAGRVTAYFDLAERHIPGAAALFRDYAGTVGRPSERGALSALYEKLPASNFSRAVLERARSLAVLPVDDSGWSDWGSPERVFKSLEALGQAESLRSRLISDESAWHGRLAHSQPGGGIQSAT